MGTTLLNRTVITEDYLGNRLREALACAVYPLWKYRIKDIKRCSGPDYKSQLIFEILRDMYLQLPGQYLFPDADRYEEILLPRVFNTLKPYLCINAMHFKEFEVGTVPPCASAPDGCMYKRGKIKICKAPFAEISDRFVEKLDITINIDIFTRDHFDDFHTYGQYISYYRKQLLDSWNGHSFGCLKADARLVACDLCYGEAYLVIVMQALLGLLNDVWHEREFLLGVEGFQWNPVSLGMRRYRNNLQEILSDCNYNPFRSVAELLMDISKESELPLVNPKHLECPDSITDNLNWNFPSDLVCSAAGVLEQTDTFKRLSEIFARLQSVFEQFDSCSAADGCRIVNCWNRSVHRKAATLDQIKAMLLSRFESILQTGLRHIVWDMECSHPFVNQYAYSGWIK